MGYQPLPDGHWAVDLGGVHVVFGDGALDDIGTRAAEILDRRNGAAPRALIVTDPGLVAAGHVGTAVERLSRAGFETAIFDGADENPTTEHVARGVEAAEAHRPDLLIGLGGGSSMDCAKGINFLYTQGGAMEDYWGVDKATRPMLPTLGVPTTAGTGSEAQRFALISSATDHRKMACGDRKARFRTVILDPALIETVPRSVAAVTGIDALSHAVESFVTTRRNPVSTIFARDAFRLIERSFETYLRDASAVGPRGDMLLGAHLAGAAIEASMLGAAHSCANPLTARFGLVHGQAVGLMLPHVVRFNGSAVPELYGDLASAAGLDGIEALGRRLAELLAAAGLQSRLESCGVTRDSLELMADEAAAQWTANFNPRTVDADACRALYEAAF